MAFHNAIEAAKAVNSLLLSARDQESLLAVAEDFTSPSSQEEDSDQEDKTEMELDVKPGTYNHTHKKITFINSITMVHTFL